MPELKPLDPAQHTHAVTLGDGRVDWKHLLDLERAHVVELQRAMKELVFDEHWQARFGAALVYPFYWLGGQLIAESNQIARTTGVLTRSRMALCQRQYSLAQFGCTTAMLWDSAQQQMLCLRSLDWPKPDQIASATRYLEFHDARGETRFRGACLLGMVGMLTAVKPGAFSIALNRASVRRSIAMLPPLLLGRDPTFLIRELLCDSAVKTYQDALRAVRDWEPAAPCFISLCGIAPDEACVVEFPQGERAPFVRTIGNNPFLVQTNHYDPDGDLNDLKSPRRMTKLMESSPERRVKVEEGLRRLSSGSSSDLEGRARKLWTESPVLNDDTAHFVTMRPATGALRIWTRSA
jgi:hypothetical protein